MTKLKTFAKDHGCRLFGPSEFEQEQGYGDTSATGHVQGFGMGVKIGVGWLGSMPEGAYEVSRVARPLAHAYLKGPSLATMFKNFQLKEEKVSSGESGWDPEDDEFENDYQEGLPHVLFVMTGNPY